MTQTTREALLSVARARVDLAKETLMALAGSKDGLAEAKRELALARLALSEIYDLRGYVNKRQRDERPAEYRPAVHI